MMAKYKIPLLLFILLLAASACTHAPKSDTDLYLLNLHGRVRSVDQNTYYADPDSDTPVKGEPVQGQIDARFNQTFNAQGYTTQKQAMMADGQIMTRSVTEFDSNELPEKEYVYNGDDQLIHTTLYIYDEENRLVTREVYDEDNVLKEVFRMSYNDKGYLVKIVKELTNGLVVSITDIKNNKLGYPLQEKTVSPAGNGMSQVRFQREENGKLLFMTTYSGGGQEIMRITYNGNGYRQICQTEGREIAYDYQYDKEGNWTKKVIYEDGKPAYIVERSYQYF